MDFFLTCLSVVTTAFGAMIEILLVTFLIASAVTIVGYGLHGLTNKLRRR